MTPTPRKPFGMLMIIALIAIWAVFVVSISPWIAALAGWLQAICYAFLGTVWIAPLGPMLRWMETGKWRD